MSDTLRNAINGGFARFNLTTPKGDPGVPVKPWKPPQIAKSVIEVSKYPTIKPVRIPDPTLDNQAQQYQEDSYIAAVHINGASGYYEASRFYVPHGRIGVIRQCWQWLELSNPIAAPPVIGTPFDALAHTRDLGGNPVNILWQLRLYQGHKTGPLEVANQNKVSFGYGYPGFANWSDLRFPWGSAAPVFWLVPENFTIVLYADIQTGKTLVSSVGGRLAGYTQVISKDSVWNTRHGFQW